MTIGKTTHLSPSQIFEAVTIEINSQITITSFVTLETVTMLLYRRCRQSARSLSMLIALRIRYETLLMIQPKKKLSQSQITVDVILSQKLRCFESNEGRLADQAHQSIRHRQAKQQRVGG